MVGLARLPIEFDCATMRVVGGEIVTPGAAAGAPAAIPAEADYAEIYVCDADAMVIRWDGGTAQTGTGVKLDLAQENELRVEIYGKQAIDNISFIRHGAANSTAWIVYYATRRYKA